MTVLLTPDLEHELEQLALESDMTVDALAEEAIGNYVKRMQSLIDEVREGEQSAQQEGWLTTEEVFERLNKRFPKTA